MRPIMSRTKGITSAATLASSMSGVAAVSRSFTSALESLRLFSRMVREKLELLLDELGELGLLALCGRFRFRRRCHPLLVQETLKVRRTTASGGSQTNPSSRG